MKGGPTVQFEGAGHSSCTAGGTCTCRAEQGSRLWVGLGNIMFIHKCLGL